MKLDSYNNLFFQSSNPYHLLRHTANEHVLDIHLLEILFFPLSSTPLRTLYLDYAEFLCQKPMYKLICICRFFSLVCRLRKSTTLDYSGIIFVSLVCKLRIIIGLFNRNISISFEYPIFNVFIGWIHYIP